MNALKFSLVNRQVSLLVLAGSAVVFSTSVSAQMTPGFYVGGNVGGTRGDFNNDSINRNLANQRLTVTSTSTDNSDTGYKVFGGYQFTPNFAIEGGYFDLGNFDYRSVTTPLGAFNGTSRVKGLNLDLVGTLPITDRFSAFGRVGAAYARTKSEFTSTGAVPFNATNRNRNDTDLKVGLGLQYAFTDALSVRAEIERYRINDALRDRGNVNMASIGLVYRFGERAQAPVRQSYTPVAAPAPVYVAPAPAPAPAPVYVAPPAPMPAPTPAYEAPVRPAKQGRN
ncbi:MAG: outer membrane beta-barrel protein [Herminiimonas sp.]|nr:outer membrane beta-barrel protein [Herminiimonas sp.]